MASASEIENKIAVLKKEQLAINNASRNISVPGTFVVGNKNYSENELRTRSQDIASDISVLEKLLKPVRDAEEKVKSAAATGPGQKLDAQGKKILEKEQKKLAVVKTANYNLPVLKTSANVSVPSTTTTTVPKSVPTTTVPKSTTPTTTVPATPTTTTTVPKSTTPATTPATSTPATTPATTKPTTTSTTTTKKTPKKTTKKTPQTNTDAWKTIVQTEFGSMWDIYNDNADVKAVIDKSVKEGWYNDQTKLTAALQNTNWYRSTESSVRQFMIQQSSDPATVEDNIQTTMVSLRTQANNSGIVLSDNSLRSLATNKLKFGWTDQQLFNAVGSEAVATAQLNGNQGMADLRRGQVQTNLRVIADNYAQKPTQEMLDEWTKKIMTGTTTDTQFTDLMKLNASTQFRSLQPQLDKGVDVKTALNTYTNTAQQVLGVDPATIDWTQDKWNKALNYQDPKTNDYRAMDSWEWNKYLRSLPEWQETDDAKRTYRNAAFTLAQAFGKTS